MSDDWKEYLKSVKQLEGKKTFSEVEVPDYEEISENIFELKAESPVKQAVVIQNSGDNKASNNLSNKFLELSDFSQIDGKWQKILRKGSKNPEAIIDLHGYNKDQAYDEFFRFIQDSIFKNRRLILVITGKGYNSQNKTSVIKNSIEDWVNLSGIRENILAYTSAHQSHGGEGAFYILLKRARS